MEEKLKLAGQAYGNGCTYILYDKRNIAVSTRFQQIAVAAKR